MHYTPVISHFLSFTLSFTFDFIPYPDGKPFKHKKELEPGHFKVFL
jgi:hypothetical protein